jgi:rhamnose transport system permease protein
MIARIWERLRSWEGFLLAILVLVVLTNIVRSPFYLGVSNQVNLFQLSIEKIIVALIMTAIIINGEIDLSVASVMGLSACVVARLHELGAPISAGILAALLVGLICGLFNGFWVAYVGLPSLAVTLAGLIGYRGVARVLLGDRSIGGFPEWFNTLGQRPLIGPFPLGLLVFFALLALAIVILQRSGFGRYIYVIGNNSDVARYSAVRVQRVKLWLVAASGVISALAGLLLAARLGAVRGNTADGFELDIITMVLLGGVSIFGGSGTLRGVALAICIVLNLRNGLGLANVEANTQTGIIGAILIGSVLLPNLLGRFAGHARRTVARRRSPPDATTGREGGDVPLPQPDPRVHETQ